MKGLELLCAIIVRLKLYTTVNLLGRGCLDFPGFRRLEVLEVSSKFVYNPNEKDFLRIPSPSTLRT